MIELLLTILFAGLLGDTVACCALHLKRGTTP
jgi:hypothetical protein